MAATPTIDIGPIEKSIEGLGTVMSSTVKGVAASVKGIQSSVKTIRDLPKTVGESVDGLKTAYTKTAKAMSGSFNKSLNNGLREQAKASMGGSKAIAARMGELKADLVASGLDGQAAQHQAFQSIQAEITAQTETMKAAPMDYAKAMGSVTKEGMKFLAGKIGGIFKTNAAADKESDNEDRREKSKMFKLFSKIDSGIGSMGKGIGKMAKGAMGAMGKGASGLLGMLKKGALFLLIPALIAFMQSPMFEDLKVWVQDKLIPGIKAMVDTIRPIAQAIFNWTKDSFLPEVIDFLLANFRSVKETFVKIWSSFEGWSDMSFREKIEAVLGVFGKITELVGNLVGNLIESVLNLFGLDGKALREKYWDPIAKFFTDIVSSILLIFTDPVEGIKKLFATLWDATKGIGGFIFDITIKPLWNWIKGIFGFSEKKKHPDEPASDDNTLWGWIKGIPGKIWTWIKSIFGFSSDAQEEPKAEVGDTKGFMSKVLHAIIPAGVFTFLEDPLLWFWVNILGIPKKDGKKPSAAEAAEAIATGNADGIFAAVMGAFLPQGMIEFILNPIDWIFTKVLKLGGEGEQMASAGQKAGMVLGTAVGLFEKVLKAILPDGLVDMIMSPVNWLFRKVLGIEPNAVLDTVSEAHGIEKGDTTGLWQSMLDAILPAGLARFLGDPISYIFTDILKLGGKGEKTAESTADKAKIIAGTVVGLFESVLKAILPDGLVDFILSPIKWLFEDILGIKVGESLESVAEAHGIEKGDTSGLFESILSAILPAGLVDFIMSPWTWLKTKLGLSDKSTETMDLVDAEGKPIVVGKTDGIFDKILKAMLPDGLVDFLKNPIGWVMNFLGIGPKPKEEALELGQVADVVAETDYKAQASERRTTNIKAISDWLPDIPFVNEFELVKDMFNLFGLRKGGKVTGGQFALVGEEGPELVKFKRPGVVASNEQMMAGRDFAMNASRLAAASNVNTGSAGSTNIAPVIVNAPSQNSVANTKVEAAVGLSDPYTHLARAY